MMYDRPRATPLVLGIRVRPRGGCGGERGRDHHRCGRGGRSCEPPGRRRPRRRLARSLRGVVEHAIAADGGEVAGVALGLEAAPHGVRRLARLASGGAADADDGDCAAASSGASQLCGEAVFRGGGDDVLKGGACGAYNVSWTHPGKGLSFAARGAPETPSETSRPWLIRTSSGSSALSRAYRGAERACSGRAHTPRQPPRLCRASDEAVAARKASATEATAPKRASVRAGCASRSARTFATRRLREGSAKAEGGP